MKIIMQYACQGSFRKLMLAPRKILVVLKVSLLKGESENHEHFTTVKISYYYTFFHNRNIKKM